MTTIAQGIIEFGGDASGVTAAAAEVGKSLDSIGSKVKTLGSESGDGFKKVEDGAKGAAKATQTWNEYLKENIAEARKQFAAQDLSKAEAYSASVKKVAESWKEMQKARQSAATPIPLGAGDVDALTKAQDRLLNSIARQATVVTEGKVKWLELRAAQAGISEQATPYIAKLKSIEKSTSDLGISQGQLTAAMRNVPAQFTDIITSLQGGQKPLTVFLQQGGQLKDMFGGAGNAARALGGYVLGLVNPFTVAAAAIGGIAYAYSQSNETAKGFQKTLILTGNAAGTTSDQMIQLTKDIAAVGAGSVKSANEAVNALAATGKVSYSVLEQATLATVRAQDLLGKSVQDTSKEFAELAKSPTKSITDLNEKYNFLTLDIYKQIKALEDQGKATEAASLAQKTYADSLISNASKVNETLTDWERGWLRIKKATSDAADAALRIFDEDTTKQKIDKFMKQYNQIEDLLKDAQKNGDQTLISRYTVDLDQYKRQILILRDVEDSKIRNAKAQEASNKAEQAGIEFAKQGNDYLSKSAKMQKELTAATELYLAGSTEKNKRTEKDIELTTRLDKIREKYKDSVSKEESAYKSLSRTISEKVALSQVELNSEKPLTESQKLRVKLMELVADGHGKITQAQISEQAKKIDLIRSNELARLSYESLRKEIEKFKPLVTADDIVKSIEKQDKAYSDIVTTQREYRQSLQDNADLMQLENSLAGQSATDKNVAIEQYKIQIALNKELLKIKEDINLSDARKKELSDTAKENANFAKSQAALKVQQGEWSKFYGEIYNGLADSLYRGFEAGKGFGKSFLDSIKNLFKTNIIKIGVQAIMGGGIGLSGAASAATGAGNAASGIGGLMSSISGIADFVGSIGTSAGVFGSTGFMASLAGGLQGAGVGSGLTSALGLQIGNTVSSVLGTSVSSAISSGISAASSVLGAIPVWGWAALAGGALLSKFGGGGDRVTGQQSISGTLGTSNISRDVPFTKSGGLLGKSDAGVWNYNLGTSAAIASNGKSYVDTASQASDTAMLQTLNSNYAALQEAAKGYASILGLSADAVTSVADRINFNLGKTKEETEAAMQAAFGQIANDITNRLSPAIASFSKEGEQVSATMARLAGSLVSVNQVMSTFGMKEFAKTLEGGNAAARLAELTGGIEKLSSGTQFFFENFLTDAEKIKPSIEAVSATMARLGQSSVDTIPEFKSLVQGLDLTTESGAKMYAELIAIAPQFKAVADYMGQATVAIEDNSAALKRAQVVAEERKALQDELNSYQQQYNELTLTSAELLKMQKDALDESNKGIFDDIQALKLKVNAKLQADAAEIESAKAVAKEAEKIATQREGLQSRYNALQDEYNSITLKSAELLHLQKSAINSSNIDLFDSIQLIQEKIAAEKALAAEKKAIEDQGIALQEELNNLKMTEADRSAKQAAGIAQVNRDIYDQIIALKAKNKADEDAIKLAEKVRDQNQSLQDELDRLTMNEEQLYEKRKATYYKGNQDLFDQIEQVKKLQASELKAKDEYLAKIAEQKRISDAIDAERATLQDEYNQLTMTEVQLMELKRSTLNESNRDLFDLIQAEKLRRAEQSKIEEAAKTAQSQYAQSMQAAADSLKSYLNDIVGEFGSLAKSLRDFSRGLTVGETSKISPEDRYKLLGAEVNALLPKVQSGDKKALGEWTKISEEYLKSSQDYNATNLQYFKDLAFIKEHTDAAAIYAQSQVDVAQLQLDLMGDQLGALQTLNASVQDVVSAINGQASASVSTGGSGAASAVSSMSLVEGYKGNVLQNLEGYGGLDYLYNGATSGNTDAYKTLKKQMDRWKMMGLDKNALDMILGGGWYEKLKAIPGFAKGGLANGLAMVGENGAELVNFKSPARVYNSSDTKSILGGNAESSKETNDLLKKQNALMEKLISKLEGASEKQIKAVGNVAQKIGVANANVKFEKAGT